MHRDPAPAGTESVWDYPRPPRVEAATRRVRIDARTPDGGLLPVADVPADPAHPRAWRVLETSHPPTYYVAADTVDARLLAPAEGGSWCEWKGRAAYLDLRTPDGALLLAAAAWTYPEPTDGYAVLAGALAFYPGRLVCHLDDERVRAQPGDFYGGWITDELRGPFKGDPGTLHW